MCWVSILVGCGVIALAVVWAVREDVGVAEDLLDPAWVSTLLGAVSLLFFWAARWFVTHPKGL
jgi:hypothetical protein